MYELSSQILKKDKSFAEIVKENDLWYNANYYDLIEINARNEGKTVKKEDILSIHEIVYENWYSYLKERKNSSQQVGQEINLFLGKKEYEPKNMTGKKIIDFYHSGEIYRHFPTLSYSDGFYLGYQSGMKIDSDTEYVPHDFIHCRPFGEINHEITSRLYLNVNVDQIKKLVDKLTKACFDKRLKFYFKFWTSDDRNDTFLIYVDFQHMPVMVDVLRGIKKESPEIFEGAEKMNPFLAKIDNFIGYGDEPKYKSKCSFNSVRTEVLTDFKREFLSDYYQKERKDIAKQKNNPVLDKARNVEFENLESFLIDYYRKLFMKTIEIRSGLKYFQITKALYSENAKKRIAKNKAICSLCQKGIPPFVEKQIRYNVNKCIEDLANGQEIHFPNIEFKLKNNKNTEVLSESIPINYDIERRLFNVYGSFSRLETLVTDENLKPFLERHHISKSNPAINIENEKLFTEWKNKNGGRNED